jgi:hypothetical protein
MSGPEQSPGTSLLRGKAPMHGSAIPTYYASTAVIRSFGTNETYVGVKQISALA